MLSSISVMQTTVSLSCLAVSLVVCFTTCRDAIKNWRNAAAIVRKTSHVKLADEDWTRHPNVSYDDSENGRIGIKGD